METLLVSENSNMADEIEHLKVTVAELREENNGIRTLLDINKTSGFKLNQDKAPINPKPPLFLRHQLKIALLP